MALELKDRIYTDCVSTGTDDAWIGETKEGYSGWEVITPNATVYYCITDNTQWEVGYGNYVNAFGAGDKASKAIKRNLLSSSTGSLLELSGNASIFLTYPSEKAVFLNTDGDVDFPTTNVRFKNATSDQVISPVIATEAVIVDGTAGSGGDLAKLLNVYTKDEVDDLHEQAEDLIEKEKIRNNNQDAEILTNRAIIGDNTSEIVKIQDDYLPLAGGTNHKMSGNIYMADNNVTGLAEPGINSDATTKFYVDTKIDNAIIETLHVRESSFNENTNFGVATEFYANSPQSKFTTELKFKEAFNHKNQVVSVDGFKETGASRVKVYIRETAELVYDGIVKYMQPSPADEGFATVNCLPVFTAVNHDWLRTSKKYTFILENIVEDK